jgi:predicted anti-sigma-YlaC factor YlaD
MTERACEQMAELLVDYADGELSAEDRARVETHLRACQDCRRTVDALRRSLVVAQDVWRQTQGHAGERSTESAAPCRASASLRRVWSLRVAAGIALLVGITLAWWSMARPKTPPLVASNQGHTNAAELSAEAIAKQIHDAGASSQLLAAADYLAEQPGGRELALEQYRLIVNVYSGTDAAAEARARLGPRS